MTYFSSCGLMTFSPFFSPEAELRARAVWSKLQEVLDLGEWAVIDDCLGCIVVQTDKCIEIAQQAAVKKLLKRAGMQDCKPVDTPIAAGFKFTKEDCPGPGEEEDVEQSKWYRSILASCIYLGTWTRPDISLAVSKLCKYSKRPGNKHVVGLKRLLRYLRGTENVGLRYDNKGPEVSECMTDSAHGDDYDTRRSTMSYLLFLCA